MSEIIKLEGIYAVISIGIVCLTVLAIFITIAILIIKRISSLKIGNIEVNKQENASCSNRLCDPKKWKENRSKYVELDRELFKLGDILISDQMNFVDDYLRGVRKKDTDFYRDCLAKITKLKSEYVTSHDSYKTYVTTAKWLYSQLIDIFKRCCLQNCFLEKTDWDGYVNGKLKLIIDIMNEELEFLYTQNLIIPFGDFQKMQRNHFRADFSIEIIHIFNRLKELTIESKKKRLLIIEEMQKLDKEVCGE